MVNRGGPLAKAVALSRKATVDGLSAADELYSLKEQIQDVARVCMAVARGDLTKKITVHVEGPSLMVQLKEVINAMVDKLGLFAAEITRVSQEVGTEGKLGGQAHVEEVEGTWRDLTSVVNVLAGNLTSQVGVQALVFFPYPAFLSVSPPSYWPNCTWIASLLFFILVFSITRYFPFLFSSSLSSYLVLNHRHPSHF